MTDIKKSEEPHELRLDLPAAHAYGRMARQMVRQFALREGVPEEEVKTLEFVAGELLDNAVDHGGGDSAREAEDLTSDVRMTIELRVIDERWLVRVGDQGGGELEELRELVAPESGFPDLEDERGRGFFLIADMVDELGVDNSADGLGLVIQASRKYGGGE